MDPSERTPGNRRRGIRAIATAVRQKRFSVSLIALVILAVLAFIAYQMVPYDSTHDRITTWFWTTLAIAALELFAIAAWDWAADRWHRLPHLITDTAEKGWPVWAHTILIPLALLAGMLVDRTWVH